MTPVDFIAKWSDAKLRERAGSQSHFIDLCKVLGEQAPTDADPKGEWYAFEKGAMKTGGGDGWADVWKRGCFAWEYKSPGKDLNAALKQLQYYVRSLESPPLLIVSDMEKIELHTNWTNTVQEVHTLSLPELADARRRQILKKAFSETDVEELKPGKTREALTKEVAEEFVRLAQNLRDRGHDPEKVAHFVNRMVFCMFAEDVDLLPDKLFKRMLLASEGEPESFADNARKLFAAMAKKGGKVGFTQIDWFNGGIFDDDSSLPLTKADVKMALAAANKNWSNIDPSIMGTLFERGLDPGKRSQLGAHYTDPDKIMLIVNPVIVEPLTREWEETRSKIEAELETAKTAREARPKTQKEAASFYRAQRQREENAIRRAQRHWQSFQTRLREFRVLDPACGSGNFLYLALKSLKDIELKANQEWERLARSHGLAIGISAPLVGPENMLGIEINPFATELARVSVWIGEIQWMREHGFDASRNPILKPLTTIECRDALLKEDGSEAEWPEADVIIGNPPFLGAKLMKSRMHDTREKAVRATKSLRSAFSDRLPGFTDLVCYWFEKARAQVVSGESLRVGLVATKAIAKNTNLPVMRRIADELTIHDAWSNEPWIQDGAAVRVAIACFSRLPPVGGISRLDGAEVEGINPNLTTGRDISVAEALDQNDGASLLGIQKSGPFDIPGHLARQWLSLPANPNGLPNREVLKPYWNGDDLTERSRDIWIIDLPRGLTERDAALFQAPFEYLRVARYDPESKEDLRLLKKARSEPVPEICTGR